MESIFQGKKEEKSQTEAKWGLSRGETENLKGGGGVAL